jgi:hypothetical protein
LLGVEKLRVSECKEASLDLGASVMNVRSGLVMSGRTPTSGVFRFPLGAVPDSFREEISLPDELPRSRELELAP